MDQTPRSPHNVIHSPSTYIWGEPGRAPHRRYKWAFAIYVCMLVVVRTSLRLLLRTTNIFRILSIPHAATRERLVVMNSQCTTSQQARERTARRRERERARRADETAKQRETRLRSRRVRDRVRRAAQTAERRESDLQLRRDRVSAESFEEREARLYPRRERLSAESSEEREARLHPRRERLPPSLLRKGRPGYSRGVSYWPPSLLRKGRPGYSRGVSNWPPSLLRNERDARLQSRRERLAATTSTVQRCTLQGPTEYDIYVRHLPRVTRGRRDLYVPHV